MHLKIKSSRLFKILIVLSLFCTKSIGTLPTRVVGIFFSPTCAPALAASLAVEKFNSRSFKISYKTVLEDDVLLDASNDELHSSINESVIVTGNPTICELLSPLVYRMNSYLICYGSPRPKTLRENVYLAQPNPEALIPPVYSLIQKMQSASHSSSVVVSLVVDRNHTSNQDEPAESIGLTWHSLCCKLYVQKSLFSNLSSGKIRVNSWWLEDSHNFSSFQLHGKNTEIHVVVATFYGLAARNLLCEVYHRKCGGEKTFLVLLGPIEKDWVMNIPNDTMGGVNNENCGMKLCKQEQLLAAAEGHFLLEFAQWNMANEIASTTKRIQMEIIRRLQANGEHIYSDYYTEAPLAYDSVSAMAGAITRAMSSLEILGITGKDEELETLQKELEKSFIGVSGEFSFKPNKVRSGNKATITINRFEDGKYMEVAKYFNANPSFSPPLAKAFLDSSSGWNQTLGKCVSLSPPVCGLGEMLSLGLLLVTVSLVCCVIVGLTCRLHRN